MAALIACHMSVNILFLAHQVLGVWAKGEAVVMQD